jgi:hypothetical protein
VTVTFSRRGLLTLACMTAASAVLSSCGKKGQPLPPPDEPSYYPRKYPSPNSYPHPEIGGSQTRQNRPPEQGQPTPDGQGNDDSGMSQ